jgi:anaerobic magnesium-protoporphyrin IX monomethyl ester cyclase
MTTFFPTALRVMEIAKLVDADIVTVVGGPHATFTARETVCDHPQIDMVGRGEGEGLILDLVRCLESGGDLSQLKGVTFLRDGQVVETPVPQPVDVNELPLPAYHLLPMHRYRFFVLHRFCTMLASRGCPYKCTFCAERGFWGDGWGPRDPVLVGEELKLLCRKYDPESIWFGDDCFNLYGQSFASC